MHPSHKKLIITVFGGTGDLAKTKLFPALFDLFIQKKLPANFVIIGIARETYLVDKYRAAIHAALASHGHTHAASDGEAFCQHIEYLRGDFYDAHAFDTLKQTLASYGDADHLFYCATSPAHYEQIATTLGKKKFHHRPPKSDMWFRLMLEKPFGVDAASAHQLERTLTRFFSNEHIYRIDHYLAKEAALNILSLRFSNILLNRSWNHSAIEAVDIVMKEKKLVGERTGFYDTAGALIDVGQNHLLQILALVTMDQPKEFTADAIRIERTKILQCLRPLTPHGIATKTIRAQYENYEGAPDTETFFSFTTSLSHKRWHNIPVTVSAGKGLDETITQVRVTFRDVTSGLFTAHSCKTASNVMTFTLSPQQSAKLTLNYKDPGLHFNLHSCESTLGECRDVDPVDNAYQRVLLDCIEGDQTNFASAEEVAASWDFIHSITTQWHKTPLLSYTQGSAGPEQANIRTS